MSIFDVDDDHYDPIKEMNSLKYYPMEDEMNRNNIISDSTSKQKEIVDRIHKTKKVIVNKSHDIFYFTPCVILDIYRKKGIDLNIYKYNKPTLDATGFFKLIPFDIEKDKICEIDPSKLVYSEVYTEDIIYDNHNIIRNMNFIYPNIIPNREDKDYIEAIETYENSGCYENHGVPSIVEIPENTKYKVVPIVIDQNRNALYEEVHEVHRVW